MSKKHKYLSNGFPTSCSFKDEYRKLASFSISSRIFTFSLMVLSSTMIRSICASSPPNTSCNSSIVGKGGNALTVSLLSFAQSNLCNLSIVLLLFVPESTSIGIAEMVPFQYLELLHNELVFPIAFWK